jgi:hypothetical protein
MIQEKLTNYAKSQIDKALSYSEGIKKGYIQAKSEWVGLTKEEIDQGLLRSFYVLQKARAWRDGVAWAEEKLKEKNT